MGLTFIEIVRDENDDYIEKMSKKGHRINSKVYDLPYRLNENLVLLLREMIKIIYDKMESVPFNDLAFSMQFMTNWL